MCDSEGLTREHVPPRCFFAKPRPNDMVTVPSCKRHNNDNAKDVEYVRNIIVMTEGVNDIGIAMFPTVRRSLKKSPKLTRRILSSAKPIMLSGQETAIITSESRRFKAVMRAVAYAVYFNDFRRSFDRYWGIYHATLLSRIEMTGQFDSTNQQIRDVLHSAPVAEKHTNHPDVFRYAIYQVDEWRLIYKFQFYEGFIVYAFGLPDAEKDEPQGGLTSR